MKNLFVPYDIALKLKEKGFDEPCIASVDLEGIGLAINDDKSLGRNSEIEHGIYMPLYQQAIDWMERHFIYILIDIETLGSDEWEYAYIIKYIPKENRSDKKRAASFQYIKSFKDGEGGYSGAWSEKTECVSEAIKRSLKLI